MNPRHFLTTILLLFSFIRVEAQNDEHIIWNYNVSHGLPTNNIYHLLIDHTDRIWFGSDYGVTCFDGSSFRTYTTSDGLTDNTVIRLYEDSLHRIWFQHLSALPTYFENGIIHQLHPSFSEIRVPTTCHIMEPDKGKLLIGAKKEDTAGLLVIYSNLKHEFIPIKERILYTNLIVNDTLFLMPDMDPGNRVIKKHAPQKSVYVQKFSDFKSDSFFMNDFGAYYRSIAYFKPNDLVLDKRYNFKKVHHIKTIGDKKFFATSNGIFEFEKKHNQWVFKNHYLKDIIFVSVDSDSKGNIWASSLNNGLYKIPKKLHNQVNLRNDQRCLFSFAKNGNIFVGGIKLKVSQLTNSEVLPDVKYASVGTYCANLYDHNKLLFYLPYGIEHWKIQSDKNKETHTFSPDFNNFIGTKLYFSERHKNRLYFYGHVGLLSTNLDQRPFAQKTVTKKIGRIKCVIETASALLIGTQNGLYRQDQSVDTLFKKIHNDKLKDSRINSMLNHRGQILIGTGEKGIWMYTDKSEKLTKISIPLISDKVMGIYWGQNESFWAHTDLGLQKFVFENNSWKETQRHDIKTSLKVNELVNLHERNDTLILITNNTFYFIPLQKKYAPNKFSFFIQSVKVNNENREFGAELYLEKNENNITFELTAVNHGIHPTKTYYRINKGEWISNNSNNFSFSSLGPGKYTFDFKAESPFYKTAYIFNQSITIKKKWWQSTIAIVACFVLSLLFVGLIVQWRINKTQNRKRRALANELFSLQSQMNPHFTFNSLNSVQSYLSNNDKRSAQIYLADFATLMRKIMDQAKLNLITLEEEIDFLTQYINLEQRRLNNSFNYDIIVDSKIVSQKTFLPTLMLQPFVENAIWHGVAALDYPGEITISFKKLDDNLICEVRDNGLGLNSKKVNKPYHKSTGINNVKERMRLFEELFNKKMTLELNEIKDNKEKGYCVRLCIPKLSEENKLT